MTLLLFEQERKDLYALFVKLFHIGTLSLKWELTFQTIESYATFALKVYSHQQGKHILKRYYSYLRGFGCYKKSILILVIIKLEKIDKKIIKYIEFDILSAFENFI